MTTDRWEDPDGVPTLDAGPVRLRQFALDDVPGIVDASTDPLIPLISSIPSNSSEAEAVEFVDRQRRCRSDGFGYSFAVAETANDRLVGGLGLWLRDMDQGRVSAGYWMLPRARRQGCASHALRAASRWALTVLGVPRLELYAEPWNEASIRTAESAGFVREGLLRSWQEVAGKRRDMYMYSLLNSDLP
ncbi:MAG: GNAT family protein [Actinomycetota bacterium]|nr:GNAT family protein [Actinomycetota bacterium]